LVTTILKVKGTEGKTGEWPIEERGNKKREREEGV